jgi:hypothetical protein
VFYVSSQLSAIHLAMGTLGICMWARLPSKVIMPDSLSFRDLLLLSGLLRRPDPSSCHQRLKARKMQGLIESPFTRPWTTSPLMTGSNSLPLPAVSCTLPCSA